MPGVPFIYAFLWFTVALGFYDRISFYRDWVCSKCGNQFAPFPINVKWRVPDTSVTTEPRLTDGASTTRTASATETVTIRNEVDERVAPVLIALNSHKIRATYGAVGEYLGIPAISVGRLLGDKNPVSCWVVSARTGMPTGYAEQDCHPELLAKSTILTASEDLKALVEQAK